MSWQSIYLANRIEEKRWARKSEVNRIARQGTRKRRSQPARQTNGRQQKADGR